MSSGAGQDAAPKKCKNYKNIKECLQVFATTKYFPATHYVHIVVEEHVIQSTNNAIEEQVWH